jgi:hypothetical protein
MSNQPPAGPPEGWEPQPQGEGSERPTEPQWPTQGAQWGTQPPTQPPTQPTEPHEQPTEPQAERWETYGPSAPPGQDHSAWAAQRRTQPERWEPRPPEQVPTHPLSDDERRAWLAQQVDEYVRHGWQIESRTENLASLRFGRGCPDRRGTSVAVQR